MKRRSLVTLCWSRRGEAFNVIQTLSKPLPNTKESVVVWVNDIILHLAQLRVQSPSLAMFLFGLFALFASLFGGSRGSFFSKPPENTLAVIGDNVTLSCTLTVTACDNNDPNVNPNYRLHWQRGNPVDYISNCRSVYSNYVRYTVLSSGSEWTLRMPNVQRSDGGRYRCFIYSYVASDTGPHYSPFATLTVVDPINTAVTPSSLEKRNRKGASFRCEAHL